MTTVKTKNQMDVNKEKHVESKLPEVSEILKNSGKIIKVKFAIGGVIVYAIICDNLLITLRTFNQGCSKDWNTSTFYYKVIGLNTSYGCHIRFSVLLSYMESFA